MKNAYVEKEPLYKIKEGVDTIADIVKQTLGPSGKNILIPTGPHRAPRSTRDGVTVANGIVGLKDKLEDMGAQNIKSAARDTNSQAGDGTTTATILAQAIFNEGLKYITAGYNGVQIKRSIDKAVSDSIQKIKQLSREVEGTQMLESVARISANNDPLLGSLIAEAINKVGKHGSILVEESRKGKTYNSYQSGMVVERGLLSKFFITNPKSLVAEYDNPKFVIVDDNIHSFEQIQPVIRYVAENKLPLVLAVKDIEVSVLAFLAKNKVERGLKIAVIQTPGFNNNELVEDFAYRVGTRPFDSSISTVDLFKPEDLGSAKRVVVGQNDTTIVEGCGDISERLSNLDEQIKAEETDTIRLRLRDRYNKLSNSVATIHLNAESEAELNDMKYRIEDAIHATKAAASEGIVPGGGIVFLKAKPDQNGEIGEKILFRALESPIRTLIQNTGENPEKVLADLSDTKVEHGYNAATKKIEDLFQAGIIDPVKVSRTALQKAASVAGMLLTTGSCIVYEDKKDD